MKAIPSDRIEMMIMGKGPTRVAMVNPSLNSTWPCKTFISEIEVRCSTLPSELIIALNPVGAA